MFRTLAALTTALLHRHQHDRIRADDVADFYRGKTVRLVIGYGAGGGYDVYGKFFARYLGEHIPGKPTVIAQNMPGAGSRSAANWLYKVAPKDGTVLAVLSQATPADQALGQPGIQFDVRKFNWIGNMVAVNNIMITWHESGVRTIDDAKKKHAGDRRHRRELAVGALPDGHQQPVRHAVQDRVGLSRRRRHHDRDGAARGRRPRQRFLGVAEVQQPGLDQGAKVNILFQVGPRRETDLPEPPLLTELAQNEEQRQILEVISGDAAVGRPILTAPDVPADARAGAAQGVRRHACAIRRSRRPPRRPTCISIRSAARNCSRS